MKKHTKLPLEPLNSTLSFPPTAQHKAYARKGAAAATAATARARRLAAMEKKP